MKLYLGVCGRQCLCACVCVVSGRNCVCVPVCDMHTYIHVCVYCMSLQTYPSAPSQEMDPEAILRLCRTKLHLSKVSSAHLVSPTVSVS